MLGFSLGDSNILRYRAATRWPTPTIRLIVAIIALLLEAMASGGFFSANVEQLHAAH